MKDIFALKKYFSIKEICKFDSICLSFPAYEIPDRGKSELSLGNELFQVFWRQLSPKLFKLLEDEVNLSQGHVVQNDAFVDHGTIWRFKSYHFEFVLKTNLLLV